MIQNSSLHILIKNIFIKEFYKNRPTEQKHHFWVETSLLTFVECLLQGTVVAGAEERKKLRSIKFGVELHLQAVVVLAEVRVLVEQLVKVLQTNWLSVSKC